MSTEATMSPEIIESMRPIWAEACEALRTDMGTLEDLARAAARAAAARDERVAQGVEVARVAPVQVVPVPGVEKPPRVRLSDEERAERARASKRRYAARKAAERTEEERAAASAKKGALRAARAAAVHDNADAQAAPVIGNVKPPRVKMTEQERLERRKESLRRYEAKRSAERLKRPVLTDEEKRERRREWQRNYVAQMPESQKAAYAEKVKAKRAAATPEEKRARAAYQRRWYLEHKGK